MSSILIVEYFGVIESLIIYFLFTGVLIKLEFGIYICFVCVGAAL